MFDTKLSFNPEMMEDLRLSIDELIVLKAKLRQFIPDFDIEDKNDLRSITKSIKKVIKFMWGCLSSKCYQIRCGK